MIVEADLDQAVIWTKPDDLVVDRGHPRRGLGKLRSQGFLSLFANGEVRFIPAEFSDEAPAMVQMMAAVTGSGCAMPTLTQNPLQLC